MTTPNDSLRQRFRDAWATVRPDAPESLKSFGELYASDIFFQDPIQVVRGRDAFMEVNRRLLARSKVLEFQTGIPVGDDDQFFMPWTMRMTPKFGPALEVEGVTHVRAANGLIVYHRDFWDLGALLASALPGGQSLLRTVLRPLA